MVLVSKPSQGVRCDACDTFALRGCLASCDCCRRQQSLAGETYRVRNTECPRCQSHSRHRALFLWLRDEYRVSEKSGVALVFAPEKALEALWAGAGNLNAFKIDLEPGRGVDVLADLLRLPFGSEVAHLIWCHHVLEQVADDRAALRELHRVLSVSGELVVSVGAVAEGETVDFGFADKKLSGNRRAFGRDFADRLSVSGFQVEQLEYNLTEERRFAYGVYPETFYRCTKS